MGMIKKILAAGIVGAAAGAAWYYITKKPAAKSSDFADDDYLDDDIEPIHVAKNAAPNKMDETNRCGNACACKQDESEQAQEGFVPEKPIATVENFADTADGEDDDTTAEEEEEPVSEEEEAKVVLPPLDEETKEKFDM